MEVAKACIGVRLTTIGLPVVPKFTFCIFLLGEEHLADLCYGSVASNYPATYDGVTLEENHSDFNAKVIFEFGKIPKAVARMVITAMPLGNLSWPRDFFLESINLLITGVSGSYEISWRNVDYRPAGKSFWVIGEVHQLNGRWEFRPDMTTNRGSLTDTCKPTRQ